MASTEDSRSLKYAMLGEDDSTLEEKLGKYLGEVDWSYLKPHYERDTLYFVDPELDLAVVGAAMAEDQSEMVKGWLGRGDLVKIETLHARQWEGTEARFEALVISPFVLCRPL